MTLCVARYALAFAITAFDLSGMLESSSPSSSATGSALSRFDKDVESELEGAADEDVEDFAVEVVVAVVVAVPSKRTTKSSLDVTSCTQASPNSAPNSCTDAEGGAVHPETVPCADRWLILAMSWAAFHLRSVTVCTKAESSLAYRRMSFSSFDSGEEASLAKTVICVPTGRTEELVEGMGFSKLPMKTRSFFKRYRAYARVNRKRRSMPSTASQATGSFPDARTDLFMASEDGGLGDDDAS